MQYSKLCAFILAVSILAGFTSCFIDIEITTSISTTEPSTTTTAPLPDDNDYWIYDDIIIDGKEGLQLKYYSLISLNYDIVIDEYEILSSIDGKPVIALGEYALCHYDMSYGFTPLAIRKIYIPEYVEYIDENTFSEFTTLESIEVHPDNQHFKSIDGNLYTKDGTEMIKYCPAKEGTSFDIPEEVTKLWHGCFFNSSLQHITIPSTLQHIAPYAFACCNNLKEIRLPESIETIEQGMFASCKKLETVVLSSALKEIGQNAFAMCKSLETIVLPTGLTTIGQSAFSGCSALKEIAFPDSLTEISFHAFYDCDSLTKLVIPDSVNKIESSAFSSSSSLEYLYIGKGIVDIPDGAFATESIKKVIMHNSVKKVSNQAFINSNVEDLFFVGTIYDWMNLYHDSNIHFNQYVQRIHINNEYIENLVLPSDVVEIPKAAFSYWYQLKSVTISNGTEIIKSGAFANCSSLESISIPLSVTKIERSTFYNCPALKIIYFEGTKEQWQKIEKEPDWAERLKRYTLICSDGSRTIYT